jgi:hypothetical protein
MEKKFSLVAIPSVGSLQHCFYSHKVIWSNKEVGRKENVITYMVYCNTFIDLHRHCLGGDLMHRYIGT